MVGMSMTYTLFEWAKENLETLLEAQPESLVVEAMERIQVTHLTHWTWQILFSWKTKNSTNLFRLKSNQRNQRGKWRWDWYWNYTLHKQINPGKERTAHKGPEKKCLEKGRSERGGQAERLELGGRDQVSAFSWLWSWLCAVALCLISFQALASDWRRCWSWIALAVMDV